MTIVVTESVKILSLWPNYRFCRGTGNEMSGESSTAVTPAVTPTVTPAVTPAIMMGF